jgi:hypothetical protein
MTAETKVRGPPPGPLTRSEVYGKTTNERRRLTEKKNHGAEAFARWRDLVEELGPSSL